MINAAAPLSGLTLVWECEAVAHCIVEHHQGYLYLFTDAAKMGQPVDFHYLLRSPVHTSAPRKWEVSELGIRLHMYVYSLDFILFFYVCIFLVH